MENFRISDYVIFIDLQGTSDVLILNGYTGGYCKVTCEESEFLKTMEKNGSHHEQVNNRFSPGTIRDLKINGIITDMDSTEEEEFFSGIVTSMHRKKMQKHLSFTIIPSYSCNFNCHYCFQKDMRKKNGESYISRIMTRDTVDNIFKAMAQVEKEHKIRKSDNGKNRRNINFYGGEPFLKRNKEVISYIINKAFENCDPLFSAISNGSELEHYQEFLSNDKLGTIQVTLDGLNEVNDQRRKYNDITKSDSFKKISGNIALALEKGVNLNLRVNLDNSNINYLDQLSGYIIAQGWNSYKNFNITAASVFNYDKNRNSSSNFTTGQLSQKLQQMRQNLEGLSRFKLQDEKHIERFGELFSKGEPLTPLLKYNYCSAPTNMYAFDAHGAVYTCLEKAGNSEESVGHINESGEIKFNNKLTEWKERTSISNDQCKKCSYVLFCGGGCAHKAQLINGTIYSNYCDGFQSTFDRTVSKIYMEKKRDQEVKKEVWV